MGKSDRDSDSKEDEVELQARVVLTMEKIQRYLIDDRLGEAADAMAQGVRLVRRLTDGTSISGAWIEFDGPVYTTVQVRRYTMEALCTCASVGPCPHGGALALKYLNEPSTFMDLDRWLEDLGTRSKDDLLEMLRTVLSSIPAALELVGISDFDGVLTAPPPDDDDWWDDEDWEDEMAIADDPEENEGFVVDDEDDEDPPPDPETLN